MLVSMSSQVLTIMSDVTATPGASSLGWLAAGLALAAAAVGFVLWRRARGTTLVAPAAWTMAAALAVAAVEAMLARQPEFQGTLAAALWRYAAAVGAFCPLVAVLGAKRPQDRGWQWVVLSLWAVLLVPAGQALAAPTGNRLELFAAWRLVLWGLAAMGLLNYLPTRHAVAACLAACGQVGLLAPQLLGVSNDDEARWRVGALTALLVAWALAALRRPKSSPPTTDLEGFNFRWLNFRNAWGAFWALRVLQRVNQTAEAANWPVRLEWTGFTPAPLDAATANHVDQTFDSLLWRFERRDRDNATPPAHQSAD